MIRTKGFSLAELIVASAIIALMATLSVVSFSNFLKRDSLLANSSALAAAIREARSKTLASVKGQQYGVKIDADRFTPFMGSSFASSTSDTPYIFASGLWASTNIPVIVFARVTGTTAASGTIDLYLAGDPGTRKTVGVQGTGLVDIF